MAKQMFIYIDCLSGDNQYQSAFGAHLIFDCHTKKYIPRGNHFTEVIIPLHMTPLPVHCHIADN